MFAKTRYTSLQSLRVVCLLVFANLLVAVGKDNDAAQSFGNNICGLFFFSTKRILQMTNHSGVRLDEI